MYIVHIDKCSVCNGKCIIEILALQPLLLSTYLSVAYVNSTKQIATINHDGSFGIIPFLENRQTLRIQETRAVHFSEPGILVTIARQ